MSLIARIEGELKTARLARDEDRRDALSLVLNALQAAQKELQRPLSEEEELQVLQRERKEPPYSVAGITRARNTR